MPLGSVVKVEDGWRVKIVGLRGDALSDIPCHCWHGQDPLSHIHTS